MNNLSWSFDRGKYQSRWEFDPEVGEYQIEIRGIDNWHPDEVVLELPRIIKYFRDEGGFECEDFIEIERDNGEFLTAGELLLVSGKLAAVCN